jgi:hypothetical protein
MPAFPFSISISRVPPAPARRTRRDGVDPRKPVSPWRYCAVQPPSMVSAAPVMVRASSVQRKLQ